MPKREEFNNEEIKNKTEIALTQKLKDITEKHPEFSARIQQRKEKGSGNMAYVEYAFDPVDVKQFELGRQAAVAILEKLHIEGTRLGIGLAPNEKIQKDSQRINVVYKDEHTDEVRGHDSPDVDSVFSMIKDIKVSEKNSEKFGKQYNVEVVLTHADGKNATSCEIKLP